MRIDESDNALYVDSAYKSIDTDEYLQENKVKSKIIKRSYRNNIKKIINTQKQE